MCTLEPSRGELSNEVVRRQLFSKAHPDLRPMRDYHRYAMRSHMRCEVRLQVLSRHLHWDGHSYPSPPPPRPAPSCRTAPPPPYSLSKWQCALTLPHPTPHAAHPTQHTPPLCTEKGLIWNLVYHQAVDPAREHVDVFGIVQLDWISYMPSATVSGTVTLVAPPEAVK